MVNFAFAIFMVNIFFDKIFYTVSGCLPMPQSLIVATQFLTANSMTASLLLLFFVIAVF